MQCVCVCGCSDARVARIVFGGLNLEVIDTGGIVVDDSQLLSSMRHHVSKSNICVDYH